MQHLIATLLDPIAARLLPLLPCVAAAAVTVVPGRGAWMAWSDSQGWTLRVGQVWVEVDRV